VRFKVLRRTEFFASVPVLFVRHFDKPMYNLSTPWACMKRPRPKSALSAAKDIVWRLGNRRKFASNVVMRQRCRPLIRKRKCGKCDVIIPAIHSRDVTVDLGKLLRSVLLGQYEVTVRQVEFYFKNRFDNNVFDMSSEA
jgi:hypothetical protein